MYIYMGITEHDDIIIIIRVFYMQQYKSCMYNNILLASSILYDNIYVAVHNNIAS